MSTTDRLAASEGPLLTTTREYATEPPAATVAGPVFVIARSADAPTNVDTDDVLLPATGSAVVADTDAVFVTGPACAGAVRVTVTVGAVAPVASAGRVQLTETLPVLVHTQPVPVADRNVTPVGSVSAIVTLAESDGPLFTTTSEYATEPPATTVAGPVLVIARSADAVTVVLTVELLLPGVGSFVVDATAPVLVRTAACAGAVTVTVMVGAVAPAARAARVQLTETLPVLVQTQPPPAADTKVTPAGRVSVTVRFAASEGPLLTTTRE